MSAESSWIDFAFRLIVQRLEELLVSVHEVRVECEAYMVRVVNRRKQQDEERRGVVEELREEQEEATQREVVRK